MNVELPSGCNVINSASSFYNYTNNNRTRALYYIYDGKAFKANESTNEYGYNYTGTCLNTGDMVYRPEVKDFWMPHMAIFAFMIICIIVFKLLRGRA